RCAPRRTHPTGAWQQQWQDQTGEGCDSISNAERPQVLLLPNPVFAVPATAVASTAEQVLFGGLFQPPKSTCAACDAMSCLHGKISRLHGKNRTGYSAGRMRSRAPSRSSVTM